MTNEDTTDFDEHFAKISSYIVDTLHGVPLEMTEDEKEQFRIQVISNQYAERLLSEAEKTETYTDCRNNLYAGLSSYLLILFSALSAFAVVG